MGYLMACVAIAFCMEFVTSVLELAGRGRRIRKRWPVFVFVLAWWVPLFCFTMALVTWATGK